MRVWNGLDSLPDDLPPVVACIGKFDGVHLGHQEILRRVVLEARRHAAPALLITFDPHPAVVLAPDRVPPLIHSRRQKLESLEGCGLTDVAIVDFDAQLAALDGEAVEAGDAMLAWRMLGRPFALSGEVVEGSGRASELQFPTANLRLENELLPRHGVYVSETVALAARHPSVTNVGVRPTFGGDTLIVETHLLEFEGDLYGERIEVRFLARMRDEMRFASAFELADQIARDRAAALSYFQNQPIGT